MAEMKTEASVLAQEAENFDRIASELQGVKGNVDATAGSLAGAWQGQAGAAAQQALERYNQAADAQLRQLQEISQQIGGSGKSYEAADSDQANDLSSQMDF